MLASDVAAEGASNRSPENAVDDTAPDENELGEEYEGEREDEEEEEKDEEEEGAPRKGCDGGDLYEGKEEVPPEKGRNGRRCNAR